MISLRRVRLGEGWEYLLSSVACGDEEKVPSGGLAAYYAATGTPPGRFIGTGLVDLAEGRGVEPGSVVTEEALQRMLGEMADPVTGKVLGNPVVGCGSVRPVAGYDLVFSPPKSVSVLWGLADDDVKQVIERCHERAIEFTLKYAEKHDVICSRSGANGILFEPVRGTIATAFRHWTSRAGDPQLHDHVVVWNRARSTIDGQWRALDGRLIYSWTTALGLMYDSVLADLLTNELGVDWEARPRRHSDYPRYEIAGVKEDLIGAFSKRADQIAGRAEELIDRFTRTYGRQPTITEKFRLRQQATLETRPPKTRQSLADLTNGWRAEAGGQAEVDAVGWVADVLAETASQGWRVEDLPDDVLATIADEIVAAVSEKYSTFKYHNVLTEAERILAAGRAGTPEAREAVAERLTGLALDRCVRLAPPTLRHVPAIWLAEDGNPRTGHHRLVSYTTRETLDAEARLLDTAERVDGPRAGGQHVAGQAAALRLGADQAAAVTSVATSGRVVDVLIGPAGTGKTTALAALRAAWEAEHGPGSVVALAPSAAAADVLAGELGIPGENLAKFLHEHRRLPDLLARAGELRAVGTPAAQQLAEQIEAEAGRWRLRAGQLVIVDEASLAATRDVDELVSAAAGAGAKILLVGDPGQLGAVGAGGVFGLLASERGADAPRLGTVRRFREAWERDASLRLRRGDETVVDVYAAHGRIQSGDRDAMLAAVYQAWAADVAAGKRSLMIAQDRDTVAELNRRAQRAMYEWGLVGEPDAELGDGLRAGIGDLIVTRQNDRTLRTGKGWVRNGDVWQVEGIAADGALTVRRVGDSGRVVLPAEYVRSHTELGYATTVHRAQGRTVDTAHAMVTAAMSREVLYVAATRGRAANHLYVDTTDPDSLGEIDRLGTQQLDSRDVLRGILRRTGAEQAATTVIRQLLAETESLARAAAEYESLAQAAAEKTVADLLPDAGFTADQVERLRSSPSYGALAAAYRRGWAAGLDMGHVFRMAAAIDTLDDADDLAAVLHHRVDVIVGRNRPGLPGRMVAGLIPGPGPVDDPDLAAGLGDRAEAIETRAYQRLLTALQDREPWTVALGAPPAEPARYAAWLEAATTVAAYRDLYGIEDPQPAGPPPRGKAQATQYETAVAAAIRAAQIATHAAASETAITITDAPSF